MSRKIAFLLIYDLSNSDDSYKVVSELFQILHLLIDNVRIIPVSYNPLNLENVGMKGKKLQKFEYLENEKGGPFRVNKQYFSYFLESFLLVKCKKNREHKL